MPVFFDKPETSGAESGGRTSIGPIETSVVPEATSGHMSIGPIETSVVPEATSGHMSIGPIASSVAAPKDKPEVDPAALKAAVGHLAD